MKFFYLLIFTVLLTSNFSEAKEAYQYHISCGELKDDLTELSNVKFKASSFGQNFEGVNSTTSWTISLDGMKFMPEGSVTATTIDYGNIKKIVFTEVVFLEGSAQSYTLVPFSFDDFSITPHLMVTPLDGAPIRVYDCLEECED